MKNENYITPYNSDDLRKKYEETLDPVYVLKALSLEGRPPRWAKNAWAQIGILYGQELIKKQGRPKSPDVAQQDWNLLLDNGSAYKAADKNTASANYRRLSRITKIFAEQLQRERQYLENLKKNSPKILSPDSFKKNGEFIKTREMRAAIELFIDLLDVVEDMHKTESVPFNSSDLRKEFLNLPVLYDALIERMSPSDTFVKERKRLKQQGLEESQIKQILSARKTSKKNTKSAIQKLRIKRKKANVL